MANLKKKMRADWDARARWNARRAIVSGGWTSEEEFDQSGRKSGDELLDGLKEHVHRDMVVLDIGCGIGRMDKSLADIFREVHGVDVSEEMIRLGRERLKKYSNIFLHVNNGIDLSTFRSQSFDFCLSSLTFDHIPREYVYNYFRETFRVLKPNGIFKFQVVDKSYFFIYLFNFAKFVWNQYHLSKWRQNDAGPEAQALSLHPLRIFHFLTNLISFCKEPSASDTYNLRCYSKAELRNVLKKCGFEILEMKNVAKTRYILWATCIKKSQG